MFLLLLLHSTRSDLQIALTGDVMLGRLVNSVLSSDRNTYVWGDTLDIIHEADLALINLECVISSKGSQWTRTWKPFHFRAAPDAIEVLKTASIDYVSLANNHVLDYEVDAFLEMLELLDKNNIAHSGAGRNILEATSPAIVGTNEIKVGIIALTDNQPEWEASPDSPGVNFIPITLGNDYEHRLKGCIRDARSRSDVVIASCHVGPHFRKELSHDFVSFAHKVIDLGADVYWGHSNHMPQGIEIYKNKVIMYDCGDFIDDYAIDPQDRNDLSFLFKLNLLGKDIVGLELIPTKISDFKACTAPSWDAKFLIERMVRQCDDLGTYTEVKDNTITVPLTAT